MRTRTAGMLALMFTFLLGACGGAASNGPASDNTGPGPTGNIAQDDKPDDGPAPDPNAYREIDGAVPEGWFTLNKPGWTELFAAGLIGDPGNSLKLVKGICTPKVPGPTEGDEEWNHWRDGVSAAILFHADTARLDLAAAMKKHGPLLVKNFDPATLRKEGELVGGGSGDERYLYAAFSNKLGTYVAVVYVASGEGHTLRAIRALDWIESLKPKE
jgi:hypothetical protein